MTRASGGSATSARRCSRGAGGGSASPVPAKSASWGSSDSTSSAMPPSTDVEERGPDGERSSGGRPRSTRSTTVAEPRSTSSGASPASASASVRSSRSSTQRIGVVSGSSLQIDGAGHDQPIHRPRHRDVVETQALGLLGVVLRLLDVRVRARPLAPAGHRVRDLEPEAAVREAEDVVATLPVAAGVGDDDDLELEPLRGVDREQPHGVGSLPPRRRRRSSRAPDRLLLGDEPHEALDVRPAQLLVGAGEAGELAQVRVAAPSVRRGRARRGRSRARPGCARRAARAAPCAESSTRRS